MRRFMLSAMPVTSPHAEPGRWSALTGLASVLFFTMAPWFSAAAILPQLRELWTLTDVASAWLTLAVQLGFVLGAVLSAVFNLADRVTPQRLILVGGLFAAASNLGLLLASGLISATLLRALTGAALALVYPSALKAMSAWFVTGRGLALGVMVGGLTLGSALPHLINGFGGADWHVVIVTTSVLAALGGLVAARVGEGPYHFPAAVFQPAQAWRMLSGRGMRLATLGYLGHMWELYAMWAWFAAFFSQVLAGRADHGHHEAAFATFAVVGIGALGCALGGFLGDRWGRTRLVTLALGCSGGCALVLAGLLLLGAPPIILLAVSLIWGFWIIADSAQFSAMTSEISDSAYVGTALTAQLGLGYTLTAVSIALVPILVRVSGWPATFAVLALGPVVGILAIRLLSRLPEAARIAGGRG